MEISGAEAHSAIGSYPDMEIIEFVQTQRTIFATGEVIHESWFVVDYNGSLTPELVQALVDKWNLTIKWRRQVYGG